MLDILESLLNGRILVLYGERKGLFSRLSIILYLRTVNISRFVMYETFGFIINFANLFFRYNKFEANITNAIIFKTNKSLLEMIENSIYNFN